MSKTYYTNDHEWLRVEGDTALVGITEHAAAQLGDIVFVELKDVDDEFEANDEIGVIESVKAASEIYAPLDCKILEANEALADEPAKINGAAMSDGWLYKVQITDPAQLDDLMDEAAYTALIS